MNRGSRERLQGPQREPDRFNEAPIHESGKSNRRLDSALAALRFNEAPIHESGKCRPAE